MTPEQAQLAAILSGQTESTVFQSTSTTTNGTAHQNSLMYENVKFEIMDFAGNDSAVMQRNNGLWTILTFQAHKCEKKNAIQFWKNSLVSTNAAFEQIINSELVDTLLNFTFVPEKMAKGKHNKGLGPETIFKQSQCSINQLREHNYCMEETSTKTTQDVKKL